MTIIVPGRQTLYRGESSPEEDGGKGDDRAVPGTHTRTPLTSGRVLSQEDGGWGVGQDVHDGSSQQLGPCTRPAHAADRRLVLTPHTRTPRQAKRGPSHQLETRRRGNSTAVDDGVVYLDEPQPHEHEEGRDAQGRHGRESRRGRGRREQRPAQHEDGAAPCDQVAIVQCKRLLSVLGEGGSTHGTHRYEAACEHPSSPAPYDVRAAADDESVPPVSHSHDSRNQQQHPWNAP